MRTQATANVSVGLIAVSGGGADARNTIITTTEAYSTGSILDVDGQISITARDISVSNAWTLSVNLAGGIGVAAGGSLATATTTSIVNATLSGPDIDAGSVVLLATAKPKAYTDAQGVNAGTLAVGVSKATSTVNTAVTSTLGGIINAGSISAVASRDLADANALSAEAKANGSTGGLIGVDATVTNATDYSDVTTRVLQDAVLTATGAVVLTASGNTRQRASSDSTAGGLIAAGITKSTSLSDTETYVTIGNADIFAGSLKASALSTDRTDTVATSGAGGVLAGAAAAPTSTNIAKTITTVGDGASIDVSGDPSATGKVELVADHTGKVEARVITNAYGALSGAGAEAENRITSTSDVVIGDADVKARDIAADAINRAYKSGTFDGTNWIDSINGTTAGLISGAGVISETDIVLDTRVFVNDGATLTVIGTTGDVALRATNYVFVRDKVSFTTGGALSGLGAESHVDVTHMVASVIVGNGVTIKSTGDILMSARGSGDLQSAVNSETYGLGTVAVTDVTIDVRPSNSVLIGTGSGAATNIEARGDILLSTGTDTEYNRDQYKIEARADAFAGSAIPIDDMDVTAWLLQNNNIEVRSNATIKSARDIKLHAERYGFADMLAKGKATNWTTAVGGAIDSFFGGNPEALYTGDQLASAHGNVVVDGDLFTGIEREQSLTVLAILPLDGNNNPIGTVPSGSTVKEKQFGTGTSGFRVYYSGTDQDADGTTDITFTVSVQLVKDSLTKALEDAEAQLLRYAGINRGPNGEPSILEAFYTAEIARLQGEMEESGLYNRVPVYETLVDGNNKPILDSNGNPQLKLVNGQPVQRRDGNNALMYDFISTDQEAITLVIDPVYAAAGKIDVISDQLSGQGSMNAPGDASVTIDNQTAAFLTVKGVEIPDNNGGVYFVGDSVTDNGGAVGSLDDVNAFITARNNTNITNQLKLESAFGVVDKPAVRTAAFDGVVGPGLANDPSITIVNTFNRNALNQSGDLPPWPGIDIIGDVVSRNGTITISTTRGSAGGAGGDISITADVIGRDLNIESGGSININMPTSYAVGGDIYAQLVGAGVTTNNGLNAAASDAAVTNVLTGHVPGSPNLYGERITIRSQFVNVNGLIQSGREQYTLTIGNDTVNEIAGIKASGATGFVVLNSLSSSGFTVRYDVANDRIQVEELKVAGGYVEIEGNVMSTGNGEIRVLGGYADIKIENNTGYDIVIKRLDASDRGVGKVIIKDPSKGGTTEVPHTTIFERNTGNTGYQKVETGQATQAIGTSTAYDPKAGWRYAYSVGQETFVRQFTAKSTAAWLGLDFMSPDPADVNWGERQNVTAPQMMKESGYYYLDAANVGDAYIFGSTVKELEPEKVSLVSRTERSSWYGKKTYTSTWVKETKEQTIATHSVKGDYGIAVNFLGGATADIEIDSRFGGSVLIAGPILNNSGTTDIDTNGAIVALGTQGWVAGNKVVLNAGSNIGLAPADPSNPDVVISDYALVVDTGNAGTAGAGLSATTANGVINISEMSGSLAVIAVSAGSNQSVFLTSPADIVTALKVGGGYEAGQIKGGAVTLIAKSGGIGTADEDVHLDSGGRLQDKVNIIALGDVRITEDVGDLVLQSLSTSGDAYITVTAGNLLDGDDFAERDERTEQQLLNGVWSDLQLTNDSGAQDKIEETISALENVTTRDYHTYWQWRNELVADSLDPDDVGNAAFKVALGDDERDYLEGYYTDLFTAQSDADPTTYPPSEIEAKVAAAIATLETQRTNKYKTLHTQFHTDGETYDEDYAFVMGQTERDAYIAKTFKVWTEEELLYAFSAGLFKAASSTTVVVEKDNITARSLTISVVDGNVGNLEANLVIDLVTAPGQTVQLTDAERIALAAAERQDVVFLSASPIDATVNINSAAGTITRTSGDTFGDVQAGDTLYLSGNTGNSTEDARYYKVLSVSGNIITIDRSGDNLNLSASENARAVTIGIVVDDPKSPPNGKTVVAMLISNREDIDVSLTETLTASASKNLYIGSGGSIELNQVIAGDSTTGQAVRIKADGGLIDGISGSGVNVQGKDIVLEGGDGTVGSEANHVVVKIIGAGGLTARAEGDVWIDSAGNMPVEMIYSASGQIQLYAVGGSITDALNTDFTNISARIIVLRADVSIGSSDNYVGIDLLGTLSDTDRWNATLTASATDDIYIGETQGDLNIRNIVAGGDVGLSAQASIIDAVDLVDPTNGLSAVVANPTGAAGAGWPGIDITANSITLWAGAAIGSAGNDIDIDTKGGTLTAFANGGATYNLNITEVIGDLLLAQIGTAGATAFVTVTAGSIKNGRTDEGTNIVGSSDPDAVSMGKAYLVASQNIGTFAEQIVSTIGGLEAQSTTGNTWISNLGGLTVGGVNDNDDPGMVAGGSIYVTAASPVTVTKNMIATTGNITIIAHEEALESDYGDDVVIKDGFTVWAQDGFVLIQAGDDIKVEAGATVRGKEGIYIFGDTAADDDTGLVVPTGRSTTYVDKDPTVGSTVEIYGRLIADTVGTNIYTGDSTDTFIIRPEANDMGDAGTGDDIYSVTGSVFIHAGGGTDEFSVDRLTTMRNGDVLNLDGEGGTDTYTVQIANEGNYEITIHDTGAPDDGVDVATILGTDEGDTFLFRHNFVAALHALDNSLDPLARTYGPTTERINIDATVNGRLTVEGEDGDDGFFFDDNPTLLTVDGGEGDDVFQVGQVFGSARDTVDGIAAVRDRFQTIHTTVGWLSPGITLPAVLYGGEGNDQFRIYANKADIRLEGENGNDDFLVRAFLLAETGGIQLLAGAGDDSIRYNINAPVSIDGGAGFDKVTVLGTEGDDAFVITADGIFGAGLSISLDNVEESVEVDGLEGNDTFFILSTDANTVTTIIGGAGGDTFNVMGDVTDIIASYDTAGRSGVVNHVVESGDPLYDGLFARGLNLTVGGTDNNSAGIEETAGATKVIEGGGSDSYKLSIPASVLAGSVAFVTVSAAQASAQTRALNGKTILVSTDNVNWSEAVVVKFDNTTPVGGHTIYVMAVNDTGVEGDQTVMISHLLYSADTANTDLQNLVIRNVAVEVADNDKPGLIFSESENSTQVVEGTKTDTYTVRLAKAPAAGETVTVTLGYDTAQLSTNVQTLTFTLANWETPQTVTVSGDADAVREARMLSQISHAITSTAPNGDYRNIAFGGDIGVQISDAQSPGVYIEETGGTTEVVAGGSGDSYKMSLTMAPTADVKVYIQTDGQTLATNGNGRILNDVQGDYVLFTTTNWMNAVEIQLTAVLNPGELPPRAEMVFSRQPHDLNQILGPINIIGDTSGADRSLKPAVIMPTGEFDVPLVSPDSNDDESVSQDTLVMYDDTTQGDRTGSFETFAAEGELPTRTLVSGFGMGNGLGDLTFGQDTPDDLTDDLSFKRGITFSSMEVAELLLGTGNDTVTIKSTDANTVTVVHGGAGSDHIMVEASSGPLIIYGDTSADGSRYTSTPANPTGTAYMWQNVFQYNDVIDASASSGFVVAYGGLGNDVIYGGSAGDFLAGGEGNDLIFGYDGNDFIFGDSGINANPHKRTVQIVDTASAGKDIIFGGTGNDVVFGDQGNVSVFAANDPKAGTADDVLDIARLISGDDIVLRAWSTNAGLGGADRINDIEWLEDEDNVEDYDLNPAVLTEDFLSEQGEGSDVFVGGAAGDYLFAQGITGSDVVIGDEGSITFFSATDVRGKVATISSFELNYDLVEGEPTGLATGGDDFIYTGGDNNIVIGGSGKDFIRAGAGSDTILGDNGEVIFAVVGTATVIVTARSTMGEFGDVDDIEAGLGADVIIGGAAGDIIGAGGDEDEDRDIILGDEGELTFFEEVGLKLKEAKTIRPELGGIDIISTGNGDNVVLGGSAGDSITAGSGDDVIVGDNGEIVFSSADIIATIETTDPDRGGVDTIEAGLGADVVVGGAMGDFLYAGGDEDTSRDIILGDEGKLTFFALAGLKLLKAETTSASYGGNDIITTGNGDNIVLAGSGADTVTAGTGIDVILGDNGVIDFSAADIVASIVTTDPTYGGDDDIEAGLGADIVVGGVGSDLLKAGGDADTSQDIILGDEGELWFFPTGQLHYAFTVIPDLSGLPDGVTITSNDTITTGGGDNVVLGGNGADTITAGNGADILFGDNGRLDFDLGVGTPTAETERRLILARSTDPLDGGSDSILAGAGRDLVFGGTAGDYIEGGNDNDTLFGDHGLYDIDLPASQRAVSIFFREEDEGGDDTILGGAGDDVIFGQQGSDSLSGGDGEDDIVGGHNVVGGWDGADIIAGDAEDDVILGDNGIIIRQVLGSSTDFKTIDWVRVSYGAGPTLSTALRSVMRFDLSDGQGGGDTIRGGTGDDTIYGQIGNDMLYGDDGADEIVGGLGNDSIWGGAGADFVLGDEGTIYKALNTNGTAVLNTDSSWRRYIVTEDVATVTERIAIDNNGHPVNSAFAAKLLEADMILLAGGYTNTGKQMLGSGAWATSALLLDVAAGGNDTINGDAGDDVLIGQRGNDIINGGDNNDTIFGDKATNIANMGTDLPLIVNAVRLVGATAAAGIYIPIGGTVVTPLVDLMPSALTPNAPQLNLIPAGTGVLTDLTRNDRLLTMSGDTFTGNALEVLASLVPDIINSEDMMPGADTITGGNGDDMIFGDDGLIFSPIETGFATIDNELLGLSASLMSMLGDFASLSFAKAAVDRAGTNYGTTTITLGGDNIDAGGGNDIVFGDAGRIIMPQSSTLEANGGSLQAAALAFHAQLQDLQTVVADMAFVAHETTHGLINEFATKTGFTSPSNYIPGGNLTTWKMRLSTHKLVIGNDTIVGGAGNDLLVGDNGYMYMQVAAATGTLAGNKTTSATYTTIENALKAQDTAMDTALRNHLNAHHPDAAHTTTPDKKANWLFENGNPFELNIGNDSIRGGNDSDVIVGDHASIVTPTMFSVTNDSREVTEMVKNSDVALAAAAVRLFLTGDGAKPSNAESIQTGVAAGQTSKPVDWSFDGGYNYWWVGSAITDKRNTQKQLTTAYTLYNDTIYGDDGDDQISADMATIKPVITTATGLGPVTTLRLVPVNEAGFASVAAEAYMYQFGPFARLLPPYDESTTTKHDYLVNDDTVYGGNGNDMMFGQFGNDKLYGEGGNDRIASGDGKDTVSGGVGSNNLGITVGKDTVVTTSGARDTKSTTVDFGGTDRTLLRFAFDRALVRQLSTDITEAKSTLQNYGSMIVGFRDYNTAAPVTTTDKHVTIRNVSINIPTPSQLIAAVRSSEIVVRMVEEDINVETTFQQLYIYDEQNSAFVAQTIVEGATQLPGQLPARKQLPSIMFDGERWITVDIETGKLAPP